MDTIIIIIVSVVIIIIIIIIIIISLASHENPYRDSPKSTRPL